MSEEKYMKILLINKYYYIKGGSETYFFGVKKLLEDNGHEVIVFSMKDSKNFYSKFEKYFVKNVDYEKGGLFNKVLFSLKLIYSFEARKNLSNLIEEYKPDIAHVNLIYHQITPSIFQTLKKYNVPVVFTAHDYKIICPNYKMYCKNKTCKKCLGGKYYNCILNKCHKNSLFASAVITVEAYLHKLLKSYEVCKKIVCPSNFMKETLISAGINEEKLKFIPNFLNDDFKENVTGKKNKKEKVILYYGRLSEEKGINILIEAKKYVADDVKLKIIGTGPLKNELKLKIENENIKNIEFLGFKSGEELKDEIRKSLCSIIPSNWCEVFGLTIIESFSMGTPVIGANIGGITELVDEGVSGYLFDRNNVEDLVKKINKLVNLNNIKYNEMTNNCVAISKKYSSEKYYKELMKVYKEVL